MANPTRPASGQTIATTWGLAVADTVVRRYPNAATRDTDLTGKTAAELLGQVVVLTDTGTIQQYAGPVLQWRPPWNLPWGSAAPPQTNSADLNAGPSPGLLICAVNVNYVAGRLYRANGEVCYQTDAQGYILTLIDTANAQHRTNVISNAQGPGTLHCVQTYAAPTTRLASVQMSTISTFVRGTQPNSASRLLIEDIGPSANPTALVTDDEGTTFVDRASLEPEWLPLWEAQDAELEAAGPTTEELEATDEELEELAAGELEE